MSPPALTEEERYALVIEVGRRIVATRQQDELPVLLKDLREIEIVNDSDDLVGVVWLGEYPSSRSYEANGTVVCEVLHLQALPQEVTPVMVAAQLNLQISRLYENSDGLSQLRLLVPNRGISMTSAPPDFWGNLAMFDSSRGTILTVSFHPITHLEAEQLRVGDFSGRLLQYAGSVPLLQSAEALRTALDLHLVADMGRAAESFYDQALRKSPGLDTIHNAARLGRCLLLAQQDRWIGPDGAHAQLRILLDEIALSNDSTLRKWAYYLEEQLELEQPEHGETGTHFTLTTEAQLSLFETLSDIANMVPLGASPRPVSTAFSVVDL